MKLLAIFAIAAFLVLAGCTGPGGPQPYNPTLPPKPNMANPASVYCEQQGGKLVIKTDPSGSQLGYCMLPDGSQCEEWAYYRGQCGQAIASIEATPPLPPNECGVCPQFVAPGPNFCLNGKIVSGGQDSCGCQLAPKCVQVACTADAKMCPDGSYVGRTGPNCEFSPCPTTAPKKTIDTVSKTYVRTGESASYFILDSYGGQIYYILQINDQDSVVFDQQLNPVLDPQLLTNVMSAYYDKANLPGKDPAASAKSIILITEQRMPTQAIA